MSEPVAKQRPMIDLDEFERRLRRPAPSSSQRDADPLAELARLVGGEEDPYEGVFQSKFEDGRVGQAKQAEAERAGDAPDRVMRAERAAERPREQDPVLTWPAHDPVPDQTASVRPRGPGLDGPSLGGPSLGGPGLGGDFAAIEAGLRGSIQPEFRKALAPEYPEYQDPPVDDDDDYWLDEAQPPAARSGDRLSERPRSRRLLYITAAIVVIGIGGIGATFAIKRTPSSPQQIAMIKAATGPAKVQAPPPVQSEGAKAIQDASLLDKTPQPPPVGLVDRVEQPVDVARAAALAADAATQQGAATVPVPVPPATNVAPSNTVSLAQPWQQGLSKPAAAPEAPPKQSLGIAGGIAGLIQPKKVKTVSVRPDGTIVADDAAAPPPPPPDAPSQTKPLQGDVAALPTFETLGATKTEPRITGRTEVERPKTPVRAKPSAVHAKPDKVAALGKATKETPATQAGDSFAVQLAAPATEAEARHAIVTLSRRYASELGGHHLKWHRAKIGEKSFYRVRVGGLSKAAATTLCLSLKAKGGGCFVARD